MSLLYKPYLFVNNTYFLTVIFLLSPVILYFLVSYAIRMYSSKPLIANSKNSDPNSNSGLNLELTHLKSIDLRKLLKDYIFSSDIKSIDLNKKQIINTINPHSYCVSKKDLLFKKALVNSDVLLPDGSGIVLGARVLFGEKIKKIAGADIHIHLLKHSNLNTKKVFYLGASNKTLDLITKRLESEFPNIEVATFSPPYKSHFNSEDSKKMIAAVNAFNPDVLFVGMTAPKQEKWVDANKKELNYTVIASIGAVFDFYAGTVKRSHPFWINLGLEWLPRLIKEPKRLWRRNFISTPVYLFSLGKAKLNQQL